MEKSADNCLYILKGQYPDSDGITKNRRGNIAFDNCVIPKKELSALKSKLQNRKSREGIA